MGYGMDNTFPDHINARLFPETSITTNLGELDRNISRLKAELVEAYETRAKLLRGQHVGGLLTRDQLEKFFGRNPAAMLELLDDCVALDTADQTVAFHLARRDSSRNDDVVYVTMPVYAFRVRMHWTPGRRGFSYSVETRPSEISALPEIRSEGVASIRPCVYAHPNATRDHMTSPFNSVCQGNNRFDTAMAEALESGNGQAWLVALGQLMQWLTTANLSDMYGTPLSRDIMLTAEFDTSAMGSLPYELMCAAFIDGGSSTVPDTVQYLLGTFGDGTIPPPLRRALGNCVEEDPDATLCVQLLRRVAWALWLRSRALGICRDTRGHALENAIWADIAWFCHTCSTRNFYLGARAEAELGRTARWVDHAPREFLETKRQGLSTSAERELSDLVECIYDNENQ